MESLDAEQKRRFVVFVSACGRRDDNVDHGTRGGNHGKTTGKYGEVRTIPILSSKIVGLKQATREFHHDNWAFEHEKLGFNIVEWPKSDTTLGPENGWSI